MPSISDQLQEAQRLYALEQYASALEKISSTTIAGYLPSWTL